MYPALFGFDGQYQMKLLRNISLLRVVRFLTIANVDIAMIVIAQLKPIDSNAAPPYIGPMNSLKRIIFTTMILIFRYNVDFLDNL